MFLRRLTIVSVLLLTLAFAACAIRQDLRPPEPPFAMPTSSAVGATAPHSPVLAVGAARLDISPDHAVILGGYGVYFWSKKHCRWSQGVHDPLYATALYFLKGDEALVLIETDEVGLVKGDIDQIRDAVATKLRLSRERVIVGATHTHHGPDTIGLWGTLQPANSGRDERYMNMLKDRCVAAAVQAYQSRRPAHLAYALGEESALHYNIHQNETSDPNLDHTITVLIATGDDGKVIATLTNWACHPTTEDAPNRLVSSDWVGVFYQDMAAAMPGVHMYVNGSIGASVQPSVAWRDAQHLANEGQGFVWAKLMGDVFTKNVLHVIEHPTPIEVDRIAVETRSAPVHMQNFIFRLAKVLHMLPMDIPDNGDFATTITAARVGPLRFGSMPGEMSPHLGKQIRASLGGPAQILVGLGQDWLGYILDEQQYADSNYSYEKMLCVSPHLGPNVVKAYRTIHFE